MAVTEYAQVRASGRVYNVIVIDPAENDPRLFLENPDAESTMPRTGLGERAGVGWWVVNGAGVPPAAISADRYRIPPDGTTPAVVTFTDRTPAAPARVTFTVNGATTNEVPLANGTAAIEVTSTTPGDTITVDAAGTSLTLVVESA